MKRIFGFIAVAVLAVPSVAFAGGTTGVAGYAGKGGNIQASLAPTHHSTTTGTLPFTGQGLLLPLLAAVLLVIVGGLLLLRTRSTDR